MTLTKEQKDIMSAIVLTGDVSKLNNEQRVAYVQHVCERVGIDWSTQPFQILKLNGKERLYATKDCTEQLRKVHGVSIVKLESRIESGLCIYNAYAEDKYGKKDASTGAVPIENLKGENLANAIMKAETKAKRRVTLSICGLGLLDESETESIPGAEVKGLTDQNATVDAAHTEVKNDTKQAEQKQSEQKQPEQKQPDSEKSVDELHKEFMVLYNELELLIGTKIAAPYHPDNWKNERTIKAYQTSIPHMQAKIKETKSRIDFSVNGN